MNIAQKKKVKVFNAENLVKREIELFCTMIKQSIQCKKIKQEAQVRGKQQI